MINPFKSKKGLGRGLSSLIGDSVVKTSNDKISISSIVPNKNQPRKLFDKDSLDELKNSIKERGIIQPLIVRKSENQQDKYEIIAINDASNDTTKDLLENYKIQYSQINVGNIDEISSNGKLTAIDTGIAESKGEIIITIDADVWMR